MTLDAGHLAEHGWVRVGGAVVKLQCERLIGVLQSELGVPVEDQKRWHEHGGEDGDLVPIWGHQAQWDIRQLPALHRIWSGLWGTQALCVTLDSCRFTPPWRPGHAEPYGIHWDHDPRAPGIRSLQGVLALTDTTADQGGFRCAPSLFHEPEAWPATFAGSDWLADTSGQEIVHVEAAAGDLIIWDLHLPHGNSKNLSDRPRLAFYVSMNPPGDEAQRQEQVGSWRTGRCCSWWRGRPGYDRVEPWPPATLTPLGRRLLGLDSWSG